MASWMVHLRIADKLIDRIPNLSGTEFIVGNLAPDSGVPNEDWSVFTPSTTVSHFRTPGKKADPAAFAEKYFTLDKRCSYTQKQHSFYLGYLTHLMTDALWSQEIVHPTKSRFSREFAADPDFIWTVKKDWYDLDFRYLRDHPSFRAFEIYRNATGFQNAYMEEFSTDAFDNRRAYIIGFYLEGRTGLDRDYPYLPKEQMDTFVTNASEEILAILQTEYNIPM